MYVLYSTCFEFNFVKPLYFVTHDNYIKDHVDHACTVTVYTYICLHALKYSYCILKVICAKGNVRGFEGKSASNMDLRIM